MVWFAHHAVGFGSFVPVAAAIILWPWGGYDYSSKDGQLLPYHMLGGALLNAVVAAVLTQFQIGMAMIFALWAAGGLLGTYCMAQVCDLAAFASCWLVPCCCLQSH